MSVQYQPMAFCLRHASTILLLAVPPFTSLRAAEAPAVAPKVATAPAKTGADSSKATENQRLSLERLQKEYSRQEDLMKEKQKELDEMKLKLSISDSESGGSSRLDGAGAESARRLESLRIETQAAYSGMATLYNQLSKLSPAELRRAVPTAAPDAQLTSLFQGKDQTEQKLADLSESHGAEHPEVRRLRRVLEKIEQQADERLQGIMAGLKTKLEAEKAKLDSLKSEMELARKNDIESSIKAGPYFQAKRELENLKMIRERLLARIIQEKMDAALPGKP